MIKERTATYDANVIYADVHRTNPSDAGIRNAESASTEPDESRRHLSVKHHLCDAFWPLLTTARSEHAKMVIVAEAARRHYFVC